MHLNVHVHVHVYVQVGDDGVHLYDNAYQYSTNGPNKPALPSPIRQTCFFGGHETDTDYNPESLDSPDNLESDGLCPYRKLLSFNVTRPANDPGQESFGREVAEMWRLSLQCILTRAVPSYHIYIYIYITIRISKLGLLWLLGLLGLAMDMDHSMCCCASNNP